MNLSMAWTTDAVLAGFKDTTRRAWTDRTLETYQRIFDLGAPISLYDKSTRQHGQHVASAILTAMPIRTAKLPPQDYDREGFTWLAHYGYRLSVLGREFATPEELWRDFQARPEPLVVVRFRLISLTAVGAARRWALKEDGKLIQRIEGVAP